MKKIISVAVALFTLCSLETFAQIEVPAVPASGPVGYYASYDAPTVPIEVALKGREAVTGYLLRQVDRVTINYTGRSIVQPGMQDHYLDSSMLKQLGYVHEGQFTELADAISSQLFLAKVIKTPDGFYDVGVQVNCYTAEGKRALSGNGQLGISENKDGTLSAQPFQPWIMINETITVPVTNIIAAKWLGVNGGEQDLSLQSGPALPTGINLPVGLLGRGYLVFADYNGDVEGWDMKTGNAIAGKQIIALLGKTQSQDVVSLRNPQTIDSGNVSFYSSNGQIYGRFPLIDLVTEGDLNLPVWFTVKVWPNATVAPARVFVTPIYTSSPTQMVIGQEYEVPFSDGAGAFLLRLQAGGYHVRFSFDGVQDWNADPFPGKD